MTASPIFPVTRRAHSSSARAFTLIEVLISITLSAMILYTAFSAFRVVSQSVTICKRLSTENNLLRTGFFAALNELDFWDLYDDRFAVNPGANPLRVAGKPFFPMTYDNTKKESDPHTWWRGFGFSATANETAKWGKFTEISRHGHTEAIRTWYPSQIKNINEKIGGYGMISYLPGDAIYGWYEGNGAVPTMKGGPKDVWERTSDIPTTINGKTFENGERGDMLPSRPAQWPGLTVEARRYVVWSSFIDLCQVEMTSPITGESTRLSFWGVGTTLRGARQQPLRELDTVLSAP